MQLLMKLSLSLPRIPTDWLDLTFTSSSSLSLSNFFESARARSTRSRVRARALDCPPDYLIVRPLLAVRERGSVRQTWSGIYSSIKYILFKEYTKLCDVIKIWGFSSLANN